jgi:hypothetical protein
VGFVVIDPSFSCYLSVQNLLFSLLLSENVNKRCPCNRPWRPIGVCETLETYTLLKEQNGLGVLEGGGSRFMVEP